MMSPRRYILTEAASSAVINTLFGIVAMLVVFGLHPAAPFWGSHGVGINMIPAVFMMTLMDVVVPTLLTRRRIRLGHFVPPSAPMHHWMVRNLLLRGILFAFVVTLCLIPCAFLLLYYLGPIRWTLWSLLMSQAVLGVIVAAIVIPVAMDTAFNEPAVR